jgi:hypothetical protein
LNTLPQSPHTNVLPIPAPVVGVACRVGLPVEQDFGVHAVSLVDSVLVGDTRCSTGWLAGAAATADYSHVHM